MLRTQGPEGRAYHSPSSTFVPKNRVTAKATRSVEEEELEEEELLSCTECGGDFEVASVEPLKLANINDRDEEAREEDEQQ